MSNWPRIIKEFLDAGPVRIDAHSARDYFMDVGWNLMPGETRITGLGNNEDLDSGTLPEDIWPGGGLYPWMTGATSLEIVSSSIQDSPSGTGISRVSLTLLDINYVQTIVNVTLNGTTPVTIPGTWFRVNAARSIAKGSGAPAFRAFNAGTITIRDAGGGTSRCIIQANKSIARQAIFTVPLGFTAQLNSFYIGLNRGAGTTRYMTVSTVIQAPTGIQVSGIDLSCDGEPYRHDGLPGVVLAEKTDFSLQVVSVSANDVDATGAFLGVLRSNIADQL